MNGIRAAGALLTLWLLTAGGCAGGAELDAVEVLNDANCRNAGSGVRQVGFAEVAALRGSRLLGATGPAGATDPELVLLLVSLGDQPTPGYHFELTDARLDNGSARINVRWATPDPEARLAQISTHPCLVVGLGRNGFDRIRVYDQTGELLGEVNFPDAAGSGGASSAGQRQ